MVEYITFKGKKYPVLLGHYSLRKFQQMHGYSVQDASDNVEIYEELLWMALEQGAIYEEKELELKKEQMGVMLDQCMLEFIGHFPKFLEVSDDDFLEKIKEVGGENPIQEIEKK